MSSRNAASTHVKHQTTEDLTSNPSTAPAYGRGRGAGGYYPGNPTRGGYRVAKAPVPHRHKTLVLNTTTTAPNNAGDDAASAVNVSGPSPSWVTKTDRHMQLINGTIYQEHAEARTRAIEQTRVENLRQKENRERNRFLTHLNTSGYPSTRSTNPSSASTYEIDVNGVKFAVVKGGSKLLKLPGALFPFLAANTRLGNSTHSPPGDSNVSKSTPKVAMVGGVKFYRTKNGNMYRQAVVQAQRYVTPSAAGHALTMSNRRRSAPAHKVDTPCRRFQTTGISFSTSPLVIPPWPSAVRLHIGRPWPATNQVFFCAGSCLKGPMCRYQHDFARVAACKGVLIKGTCVYGEQCNLSHDLTAERTPHCVHYAKGNCSKPDCPYTHRMLSPGAPVCRDFGFYGYCAKGISCPDRHAFECPDYSNTGVCNTEGCKLPHHEYANVLRKAAAAREQVKDEDDDDGQDPSSDDGDSVGSDEVDSDEVDEFMGEDDSMGYKDQDFISV